MKRVLPLLTAAIVLLAGGCDRVAAPPTEPGESGTEAAPPVDLDAASTAGGPDAGPGPSLDVGPTPKAGRPDAVIGLSLMTMTNPFFVELGDAIVAEAKKHNYQVIETSGEYNVANQKNQVNEFIAQQVDAIVLCPCDSRAIATSIIAAKKAGIPVFTADVACLDKEAEVVCHVATDNLGGGRLAGQTIVELLGGTGKVAIIDYPEVESVILRTRGFREVVDKVPGIEIVGAWPGNGDRVKSFKAAEDVLQAYPDLDAFFAINDPTGLGVSTALEKAGKAGQIQIVAFDAQPIGRRAVKEGKIYATIVQEPEKIGRKTVDVIARYMAAEEVPSEHLIECWVYRKADADVDPTLKE